MCKFEYDMKLLERLASESLSDVEHRLYLAFPSNYISLISNPEWFQDFG